MGRFESNSLAPRPSHHPPRDSRDLDGRLSGSLAAFKFVIRAQCKTIRSDSFRNDFAPRPILLFQKMRGWLRSATTIGVVKRKYFPKHQGAGTTIQHCMMIGPEESSLDLAPEKQG